MGVGLQGVSRGSENPKWDFLNVATGWVGTIFDVVVGGGKENLSFDHFQKELFLHVYIQDKFDIFPEENPGLKQHQIFVNFFTQY